MNFRQINVLSFSGLILGAVKMLKSQRAKPDPVLYLSLMHLSKSRDYLFQTKDIIDAFCSLLRRDVKEAYKSKSMSPSMIFDRSDASATDSSEEQI